MALRKTYLRLSLIVLAIPTVLLSTLLFGLTDSPASTAAAPAAVETMTTTWHTFLGSTLTASDEDQGHDVAVDSAGDIYVVGASDNGDWGQTPILTYSLRLDGFLAKVDPQGALLWHTFVGGSETDSLDAIGIDSVDNLYVVGTSNGGYWSSAPLSDAHGSTDPFVAKFSTTGERQWFTFVGTDEQEFGDAIAVDDMGAIYIGGKSVANPYLAKLTSTGEFQWQRVITSTAGDLGQAWGIAVDQSGAVYLTGLANYGAWYGAPPPVREHAGYPGASDAFVAKFDGADGTLLWHTFLGAADWEDEGHAIVVHTTETSPHVYIAGWSSADWGTPIHPHTGFSDAFVAALNGDDGALIWNTFMGNGNENDAIHALAFNGADQLWVAGDSGNEWGKPVIPHPEGTVGDAVFVAAVSTAGQFLGNTFLGGAPSSDTASGIALSHQGAVYVAGSSSGAWNNPHWGTPVRAFAGTEDAFVAGLGVQSVIRYWIYAPIIIRKEMV